MHFSKEKMASRGVALRNVLSKITGSFSNVEIVNEGNEVTLRYKKRKDIKAVRMAFVDIREMLISGVDGIDKAVVNEDKNGTFYIATSGSNLKDVLAVDGIKEENVYTNDIFEVYGSFGIEAARNALANEIMKVLDIEGIQMNFKHISLLVDTMTYSGLVKSIGRHGVSGDKDSVFARAAYEETVKH
ncbi:DNA-directed RNA polymerase, subunit A', partial [mine drainage metagenome]